MSAFEKWAEGLDDLYLSIANEAWNAALDEAIKACMEDVDEDCDCSTCVEGRIHRDAILALKDAKP